MKKIFFFLLAISMVSIVACNKDDDEGHHHDDGDYDASINIISPADGDMATVDAAITIEVEITRPDNKIIHNVLIQILDSDGNVKETLVDGHEHVEGTYSYNGTFTPTEHGMYSLTVSTTTDSGEHEVKADRSFMAMHATYPVTIDIQSPGPNTVVTANTAMDIVVNFTHDEGGTIHHVKIEVLDDQNNVVETLDSGHKHVEGSYTFDEVGIFTPTVAGTYILSAKTMNHNMSLAEEATETFTVQ